MVTDPGMAGQGAHGAFNFFLFIYSTNIYLQIDDVVKDETELRVT
jgi:hypothetical protein